MAPISKNEYVLIFISISPCKAHNNSYVQVTVYFTKNGEVVGETPMSVPEGGLYPTIGVSDGDRVSVDFAAVSG